MDMTALLSKEYLINMSSINDKSEWDINNSKVDKDSEETGKPGIPSISLPKGGGAIRGIGEKFSANPVTGHGSLTVPIQTSPGR